MPGSRILAVERSVPSEDRFKSSGLRGAVERSTVGCRGDRYKPVSARLKGLAEDSQGKAFCIHAPKLTPEPSVASERFIAVILRRETQAFCAQQNA